MFGTVDPKPSIFELNREVFLNRHPKRKKRKGWRGVCQHTTRPSRGASDLGNESAARTPPKSRETKVNEDCAIQCTRMVEFAAPYPIWNTSNARSNAMQCLKPSQPNNLGKNDLFSWHPHVIIDGGRKRCESSAAQCSSLWTSFIRKSSSCYTTSCNGIL
jgi:hypothetical protein